MSFIDGDLFVGFYGAGVYLNLRAKRAHVGLTQIKKSCWGEDLECDPASKLGGSKGSRLKPFLVLEGQTSL